MKVMLVKVRAKTLFTFLDPIVTEPLELAYLKTTLDALDIEAFIEDPLFENRPFLKVLKETAPTVMYLNGYITAASEMKRLAVKAKAFDPSIVVIVGGVHVQQNPHDFQIPEIDHVVHTPCLEAFQALIQSIKNRTKPDIPGVSFWENNSFTTQPPTPLKQYPSLLPDRSFFQYHRHKTHFVGEGPIALVQRALSCPYDCRFCYCKQLNSGHYVRRTFDEVFQEIKTIEADLFWIVDDVLLSSTKEADAFVNASARHKFRGKIIAYLRADFINQHPEAMKYLKSAGLSHVIVGFESLDDETLQDYNKQTTTTDNVETLTLLRKLGIHLSALFIVGPEYTHEDFKTLRRFIRTHRLEQYTLSIFTPMKGTPLYEEYKDQMIRCPDEHYDFLHLVLKPSSMSKVQFYFEVFFSYTYQFLHNPKIRRFLFKRLLGH